MKIAEIEKLLADDIQDAKNVQILKQDETSFLFSVEMTTGEQVKGVLYKDGLETPMRILEWEIETY